MYGKSSNGAVSFQKYSGFWQHILYPVCFYDNDYKDVLRSVVFVKVFRKSWLPFYMHVYFGNLVLHLSYTLYTKGLLTPIIKAKVKSSRARVVVLLGRLCFYRLYILC